MLDLDAVARAVGKNEFSKLWIRILIWIPHFENFNLQKFPAIATGYTVTDNVVVQDIFHCLMLNTLKAQDILSKWCGNELE